VIEIKKQLRAFARDRDGANTVWQFPPPLATNYPDDYTTLGGAAGNFFFTEATIDINGLTTMMDKALMTISADVYSSPAYAAGATLSGADPQNVTGELYEWVFVTDVPFDITSWRTGIDDSLLRFRIPGVYTDMSTATVKTVSTDNILYGRMRQIINKPTTPANFGEVVGESFFGDLKQTMSDNLYLYRCLLFTGAAGVFDSLRAPELEIVIQAVKGELSDLEQIMELRRSYLLQQTVS
tara:strand:- start:252 stop:968 length:717 start_codon:yes stop_codon:yes gene_type:complete